MTIGFGKTNSIQPWLIVLSFGFFLLLWKDPQQQPCGLLFMGVSGFTIPPITTGPILKCRPSEARTDGRRPTFWRTRTTIAFSSSPPPQQQEQSSERPPVPSASSSSSSNKEKNDNNHIHAADDPNKLPANLRRIVSAKRPLLGHVVPKSNRISTHQHQQQQTSAAGGSSLPNLRLQGVLGNTKHSHKSRRTASSPSASTTSSSSSSASSAPSHLRIVGGSQKGRRLDSPQLVYLRPMMSKVKEALYSTLTSLGMYDTKYTKTGGGGCRHLDLFAGSGSVGLESLSRGATHCTFCDFSDDCCQTIQRNLDKCHFGQHDDDDGTTAASTTTTTTTTSTVVQADVLEVLRRPADYDLIEPYSLVTICPPYEEVIYGDLLEATVNSPLVTDDTIVVVEYPTELQTLPHVIRSTTSSSSSSSGDAPHKTLIGIRNRRYGRTVIAMYICNPTGRLDQATSRPEEFVTPK